MNFPSWLSGGGRLAGAWTELGKCSHQSNYPSPHSNLPDIDFAQVLLMINGMCKTHELHRIIYMHQLVSSQNIRLLLDRHACQNTVSKEFLFSHSLFFCQEYEQKKGYNKVKLHYLFNV